mgnify:CR=1 FL=1
MTEITFKDLALSPSTLKAIEEIGYVKPSPIQAEAIPVVLAGKDIIGQAQTGTGKTAAFMLPILEKIDPKNKNVQAMYTCLRSARLSRGRKGRAKRIYINSAM